MVCVTLSGIFIPKTTFCVTIKKPPVLHCLYIRELQKTLAAGETRVNDCIEVTQHNWMCCNNTSALFCCVRSGYHVYGLRFHLNSLYFTVSNSLTVYVPTAFVHVRTVTLS
jgi:hypothetical protein